MKQIDHQEKAPSLKVIIAKSRVEAGDERCKLTFQFLVWMASSITITIATGVYLWKWDKDTYCSAPHNMSLRAQPELWTDVKKRYADILKIIFTLAIADWGRCCIMLVAIWTKSGALANLY